MVRFPQIVGSILATAFLGSFTPVFGAQHALLVGAGEYPKAPGIHSLSGPVNDVAALRNELIERWGVRSENMVVLLNETASRHRILAELDALASRTRRGDIAFFYYSGHGTSAHALGNELKLDLSTGAILPADIEETDNADRLFDQLIIGLRDIRPLLAKMDRNGVRVLVLFDACYSGDSAKSIGDLTARSADSLINSLAAPAALTSFNQALGEADKKGEDWPYQNVVYISASARNEQAWDISDVSAMHDRLTVDGKAHGAFTNAVLLGLRGAADTNHDKQISYVELHGYLIQQLASIGQTPQLHPRDAALVRQPVLSAGTDALPQLSAVAGSGSTPASLVSVKPLRVRLAAPDRDLRARLAAIAGVEVVTGEYDLEVAGQAPRFRLMHSGGTPVTANALPVEDLLRIITNRALAHQLIDVEFAAQDFNVELFMTPDQGAYYLGQRATIELRPERASWLMVFDVDIEGNVYLVYPNRQREPRLIRAGETVSAVEVEAAEPTGTEIIHAFAFVEKPPSYDELLRSVRLSAAQVRGLAETMRRDAAKPGRARVQRITFTAKK